jgi:hypothetical protein
LQRLAEEEANDPAQRRWGAWVGIFNQVTAILRFFKIPAKDNSAGKILNPENIIVNLNNVAQALNFSKISPQIQDSFIEQINAFRDSVAEYYKISTTCTEEDMLKAIGDEERLVNN